MSNEPIHISPNSFVEKTTIILSLAAPTNIKIELFDDMGQHIKNITNFISVSGSYKHDINFKELGLKHGSYFISVAIDGKVTNKRVVYEK